MEFNASPSIELILPSLFGVLPATVSSFSCASWQLSLDPVNSKGPGFGARFASGIEDTLISESVISIPITGLSLRNFKPGDLPNIEMYLKPIPLCYSGAFGRRYPA